MTADAKVPGQFLLAQGTADWIGPRQQLAPQTVANLIGDGSSGHSQNRGHVGGLLAVR